MKPITCYDLHVVYDTTTLREGRTYMLLKPGQAYGRRYNEKQLYDLIIFLRSERQKKRFQKSFTLDQISLEAFERQETLRSRREPITTARTNETPEN